jgi:hypothetical protein
MFHEKKVCDHIEIFRNRNAPMTVIPQANPEITKTEERMDLTDSGQTIPDPFDTVRERIDPGYR